jgi:acetate kinase
VRVLVVNAGSSSLKLSVLGPADDVIAALDLDHWDGSPGHREVRDFLRGSGAAAVGHRVVHGGSQLTRATLVDDAVRAQIADLTSLAPLHQQRALAGIAAAGEALPGVPQVACFDTAFPAGRRCLRPPGRLDRALRTAQVRLPRPVPPVRVRPLRPAP